MQRGGVLKSKSDWVEDGAEVGVVGLGGRAVGLVHKSVNTIKRVVYNQPEVGS